MALWSIKSLLAARRLDKIRAQLLVVKQRFPVSRIPDKTSWVRPRLGLVGTLDVSTFSHPLSTDSQSVCPTTTVTTVADTSAVALISTKMGAESPVRAQFTRCVMTVCTWKTIVLRACVCLCCPQPQFSSTIAVVLSCLGCVVGTGNIWRFPRIVANNSGDTGKSDHPCKRPPDVLNSAWWAVRPWHAALISWTRGVTRVTHARSTTTVRW